MPSSQKTKGKTYENTVAKFLTETYGENFIRVPTSGAYLGGSNYDRRHVMTEGQVMAFKGDIIPPDGWNKFNAECKFYSDFKFHQLYNDCKMLDGWISETLSTANPDDISLIFMKFNNIGEYVAYQGHQGFITAQHTKYKSSWEITGHTQFWTDHNTALLRELCTN